jgi:hypothetical protein
MLPQHILFVLFIVFNYANSELLGVIQVNRHGARTSGDEYDHINKYIFYETMDSHLTINGFQQQELLGRWIAERYMHYDYNLLNKEYDKDQIIVRSSGVERTIFSAAAFIKGLYPNSIVQPTFTNNFKLRNDDIPPISKFSLRKPVPKIPINVMDPDGDYYFKILSCKVTEDADKTLKQMLKKEVLYNITEQEIEAAINDIRPQWLSAFTNKTDDEIFTLQFLQDLNAFIRPTQYHFKDAYFNLTDTTNLVLKKIQISKWYSARLTVTEALKYAHSGFFDEFLSHFGSFQNKNKLKLAVYSGHDDNIITILVRLFQREKLLEMIQDLEQTYDFLQPGFASHLIFELHRTSTKLMKESKDFIRIIYNGQILRDGFVSDITYDKVNDGISYDLFASFLKDRIHPNYKNLYCKRKPLFKNGSEESLKVLFE